MFKKNEILKTAILTGLVLFATIGLLTIVMAPNGMSPAKAFRSETLGGGVGGPMYSGCNLFACPYFSP